MNEQTDQQLLRDYTERQSETAFAVIVQRYVDLVYSAALRLSCDTHTAKDVTQSVFVVLARNARQLTDRPALAGWLHGTARNLAIKAIRSEVRRRAREQEAAVMNELLSPHPDASWEHIAPHLDEALGELSEPDRDAVLLRYFKNHDLRTVGKTVVTATIALLAGAGIYEARQASQLRDQVQTLQQQQAPFAEQIAKLQSERDDATSQLTVLREDNERLNRNTGELLRLRGEVSRLRQDQSNSVEAVKTVVEAARWKPHQLTNVGKATPLDALQTLLWPANSGKVEETQRTVEAQRAELADKLAPFKWSPRGHLEPESV